jgi:glycosyltransferase involved in cell wall biosynthesis
MKAEIVCASRELFGSDRSAVRLASLLSGLGLDAALAFPAARPERGLSRLATAARIAAEPAPVVVASSRGVSGLLSLARARPSSEAAVITIYNSSAVVARAGDSPPRAVVLREWLRPESIRHRALARWLTMRTRGVIATSHGVARAWRACAGDRIPVEVCHNWLDDGWLEVAPEREREGILFVGRLNAWKGQETLADAYQRAFGNSRPAPSLTFLGAEPPGSPFYANAERLRRRCEASGWRLLELSTRPQEVLAEAALVVVPSLRPEPFGNVILEALATGARVIAFPGGGVDDLAPLFPGSIGVVSRDRGALAAALACWWSEGGPAQSEHRRPQVLETLRARFTATAAAPQWRRIVERLAPG